LIRNCTWILYFSLTTYVHLFMYRPVNIGPKRTKHTHNCNPCSKCTHLYVIFCNKFRKVPLIMKTIFENKSPPFSHLLTNFILEASNSSYQLPVKNTPVLFEYAVAHAYSLLDQVTHLPGEWHHCLVNDVSRLTNINSVVSLVRVMSLMTHDVSAE
jgi:hypothetical protein